MVRIAWTYYIQLYKLELSLAIGAASWVALEDDSEPHERFVLDKYLKLDIDAKPLFQYDSEPHKIALVGKEIWTIMFADNGIQVMDYNAVNGEVKYNRTVRIHEKHGLKQMFGKTSLTYAANAVTNSSQHGILAACWCGSSDDNSHQRDIGLVIVDRQGRINSVIASGRYCDVRAVDGIVYGLEMLGVRITTHVKQSKQWQVVRQVELNEEYFRMIIFRNSIFLSGPKVKAILEYTLKSKKMKKHSLPYMITSYDTYWLHAAFCDDVGNLLVCDEKNGSLLVFKANNTWHQVALSQEYEPCDAILDANSNVLVLNFGERTILKLEVVEAAGKEHKPVSKVSNKMFGHFH